MKILREYKRKREEQGSRPGYMSKDRRKNRMKRIKQKRELRRG